MNLLTYKKLNFKSACGSQVYAGYLQGEFMGYYHKKKLYKLVGKKTLNGTKTTEKFNGYGYELFHRKVNGEWLSWEEWKQFQLHYDNSLQKELMVV